MTRARTPPVKRYSMGTNGEGAPASREDAESQRERKSEMVQGFSTATPRARKQRSATLGILGGSGSKSRGEDVFRHAASHKCDFPRPPGFQKQGLRHTNRREEITPNYRKVKTTRTAITEGGAKRGPCHDTGDPWERHAGRKAGHVPHCHLHGPSWPGPGFRGEGGWRGGQ